MHALRDAPTVPAQDWQGRAKKVMTSEEIAHGGRPSFTGPTEGADHHRDSSGSSVATEETNRLIASNKVEGTAVYNRQGERLGSVYNFMVDKRSGQVDYAVLWRRPRS